MVEGIVQTLNKYRETEGINVDVTKKFYLRQDKKKMQEAKDKYEV
jgi:hypothetical protein